MWQMGPNIQQRGGYSKLLPRLKIKRIQICGKWEQTYRYVATAMKKTDLWQKRQICGNFNISSKGSQIFTKLLTYVKIGLLH